MIEIKTRINLKEDNLLMIKNTKLKIIDYLKFLYSHVINSFNFII